MNFDYIYSFLIYASSFSLSTLFVYLWESPKARKIWKKASLVLAVVVLALLSAFRESGVDYVTYKSIYLVIQQRGDYVIEAGWIWLNRLMPSYEMLLFVSAVIFFGVSLIVICRFLQKNRCLAWFAFLITCHGIFFNGMRQMIAVAFVMLGVFYLYKKKKLAYVCCVLLGSLFHTTALFMLFFIPVYIWCARSIKATEWLILILSIALVLFSPLLEIFMSYLDIYKGYFSTNRQSTSWGFLLYSLPPMLFYYFRKKALDRDKRVRFFVELYLLIIPFQIMGMYVSFADRIMLYFQPFIGVLVAQVATDYETLYQEKGIRPLYYIWFAVQYIVLCVVMNSNDVYPYRIFEAIR